MQVLPKPKVYLETTIPSYLAARSSRDIVIAAHQQLTRDWWETRRTEFDLYISELVLREARSGNHAAATLRLDVLAEVPLLAVNDEIVELAEDLVVHGPLHRNAAADAAHIAFAAVYGCDYLLTWNCRHIANAELQRSIRQVVERHGYDVPNLCTPEELMGEES